MTPTRTTTEGANAPKISDSAQRRANTASDHMRDDEPIYPNLGNYPEVRGAIYDARCAACWLGHAHTYGKHTAALARYFATMAADA